MTPMLEAFAAEMQAEFDALLKGGLLARIGTAEDYDFDEILQRLRRWQVVPSFEIAVFCRDSVTSNYAGTGMINECVTGLRDPTAFNEAMRYLVQKLRFGLDEKWGAFCASSRFGEAFRWDLIMPGDFMGYCRECLAKRQGATVEGYFHDLVAVYRAGFMPCGWDGPFPDGDLLLY